MATELGLSAATERRLEELKGALVDRLGDDLVALLVYGSAARGAWREGQSDVDVALVLRRADRALLEAIAQPLQIARWSARIEAIVLTLDEIPRAADVFPLFYEEIQRRHFRLWGADVFEGITIDARYRRLRVEQELRDAQIRLRRLFVDSLGSPAPLGHAVEQKTKQVRGALRALLSMHGIACGEDLADVLAAAGRRWDVDVSPVLRASERPAAGHEALAALLTRAIHDVDAQPEA